MRLRRLMGVADQTVASRFSSIDLSNKAYKNLFYQIKRAQNQVEARQNYWLAEGGVECGIAQYAVLGYAPNSTQPSPYPDCDSGLGVIAQMNQVGNSLVIVASQGYSTVRKAIITTQQVAAALQSTANLFMNGSFHFTPPAPTVQLSETEWECAAIRFKHQLFVSGSLAISNFLPAHPPWTGFSADNKCIPEYIDPSKLPSGLYAKSKDDLSNVAKSVDQDSDMNLFEEFYGVPATDYQSVKDRAKTLIGIELTMPSGRQVKVLENCGDKIAGAIASGYVDIWVEGGCQITESEYKDLVIKSNATDGVRIVVENGALSLMTTGEHTDPIKGLVFLFNHDGYIPQKEDWDEFPPVLTVENATDESAPTVTKQAKDLLNSSIYKQEKNGVSYDFRDNLAFFQNGRFEATGGMYIESEGASAIFNTSLKMYFNRDAMMGASGSNAFRMKRGSWYDR